MQVSNELFRAYVNDTTTLVSEMDTILKKRNSIGALDKESVDALFRIFHTIKASAAVLDDSKVVDVAYKMENIMAYLRRHGIESLKSEKVFSLLFESEYYFRNQLGSLAATTPKEFEGELTDFVEDLGYMSDVPMNLMVSFEAFRPLFENTIADMCKDLGKKADLFFEGNHSLYIDRSLMTRLSAPLTQIIRNAIDHGIETPEERVALGKPETGAITVTYGLEENIMFITIFNDGETLNLKKILHKASELHMLKKPRSTYKSHEIANLIMERGFTTKDEPTKYSGRGVGMDIIKATAEDLGGTLMINSGVTSGFSITFAFPIDDNSQRAAIREQTKMQSEETENE